MASKRDRERFRTGVNVSSGPTRSFFTNGSSARKFSAKDGVQNNNTQNTTVRSNSEHIIDHAASLQATSTVVSKAASTALDQLQAVRKALRSAGPGSQQNSLQISAFDDGDLKVAQNSYIDDIMESLGVHPVSDVQKRYEETAGSLITHSVNNFLPIQQHGHGSAVNSAQPKIDHVSIDLHLNKGSLDFFYSTVVFDISKALISTGKVKAVRIFRATVDNPDFFQRQPARLSANAVDRLMSLPIRSRTKNQDYLGQMERQLTELSIDNALSALNPTDPLRKLRVAASDATLSSAGQQSARDISPADGRAHADLSSYVQSDSFLNLDRSVMNDLKSLKNIQIQNPQVAGISLPDRVDVGASTIISNASRLGKQALRENRKGFGASSNTFFSTNRVEFKEIAFISPGKLSGRLIGDMVEYRYEDTTINYAKSYRYYVDTVDDNLVESQRSRIVQINVDGLRVPQIPSTAGGYIINGTACITAAVDDLLVEKFEIYRKELTEQNSSGKKSITVLASSTGFHLSEDIRSRLSNGFMQVGEMTNRANVGGTYYDRDIRPGNKYVYRVYSVDIFGNKSEAPKEIQIFYPEARKHVDLSSPHVIAEVAALTGKVKLTFQCDDTRVTRLFVGRRDVGLKQVAFVSPGEPHQIKLGSSDHARNLHRFDDVVFGFDPDRHLLWNGVFENNQKQITFEDKTAITEHTYQYQIYGIDRFGNQTPHVASNILFVANRALIYEPKNLQGQVVSDGANVSGIQLVWNDGNINISAEDMVGNQENLRETRIRTLFQVSRRKATEDHWVDFPMVAGNSLVDRAIVPLPPTPKMSLPSGISPLGFAAQDYLRRQDTYTSASLEPDIGPLPQQPARVIPGETYVYRVQAYQSGNFISNFSDPIVITAALKVLAPQNFRVRPMDTKARPFGVVLNWGTTPGSGIVDHWQIDRAAVNNFAAARFNALNPDDFLSLNYLTFKTVYAESSRFRERTDDHLSNAGILGGQGPSSLLTGQNHFLDQQVEFGNSYFYRIRAIGTITNQVSDWTYRGVKVTDDVYEQKQDAVLTPANKNDLTAAQSPIAVKAGFLNVAANAPASSLSLRPPQLPAVAVVRATNIRNVDVGSKIPFYKKFNPRLLGND